MVGWSDDAEFHAFSTHFPHIFHTHTNSTRMSSKKKTKRTTCHDSCPHKNCDQRPPQPCDVCKMFYEDMSTTPQPSAYKRFMDPNAYVKSEGSTKEIRVRPSHNVLTDMMDEGEGVWSSKRSYWEALAEVNDSSKDYSVFKEQVIIKKTKQNKTKQNKTKQKH